MVGTHFIWALQNIVQHSSKRELKGKNKRGIGSTWQKRGHCSSRELESQEQPENEQRDYRASTMGMSVCDDCPHHLWMLKHTVYWALWGSPDPWSYCWVTNSTKKPNNLNSLPQNTHKKKPKSTKTCSKDHARIATIVMLEGNSVITLKQLQCWTYCRWNLASQKSPVQKHEIYFYG